MDVVNFTENEIQALHDVVKNYLIELHTEISYTDDRDFKAALKKRQEILQIALDKITSTAGQLA